MICRAKRAQVLAQTKPISLDRQGGKQPDEATLIPWAKWILREANVLGCDSSFYIRRLSYQQHNR